MHRQQRPSGDLWRPPGDAVRLADRSVVALQGTRAYVVAITCRPRLEAKHQWVNAGHRGVAHALAFAGAVAPDDLDALSNFDIGRRVRDAVVDVHRLHSVVSFDFHHRGYQWRQIFGDRGPTPLGLHE